MPIPKDAYYSKACSKPGLTSTPTSSVDISALVAGSTRFWHAARADSYELHKKTLVFCDWSVATYTRNKFEKINRILGQILTEGFNVFLWQDGKIREFTHADLELFRVDKRTESKTITPALRSTILAKPKLKDIPVDQVLLMDYFWCRQQCGEDHGRKRFCISDYSEERFDCKLLIDFIKEAHLSSGQLIGRCVSFTNYNTLLNVRKLVFGEGSRDYSFMLQSPSSESDLLFRRKYDSARYKLFLEAISKNDYLPIWCMNMYDCRDSQFVDFIIDIVNKFRTLEEFVLPEVAFTDSHVKRLALNHSVNSLMVFCSSIRCTDLFSLLAKFPMVQTLCIDLSRVLYESEDVAAVAVDSLGQLSKMRSLLLTIDRGASVDHYMGIIMRLLAIMPELTRIYISAGKYGTDIDVLPTMKVTAAAETVITVVQRAIEEELRKLQESSQSVAAGCPLRITEDPMQPSDKKKYKGTPKEAEKAFSRLQPLPEVPRRITEDPMQPSDKKRYRGTPKEAEKTFSRLQPLPEDPIIKGVKQGFERLTADAISIPIDAKTGTGFAHFRDVKYFKLLDRYWFAPDPDPDVYRLIVNTKMDDGDYRLIQGFDNVDGLLLTSPPDFTGGMEFQFSDDIDSAHVPYDKTSHRKYHGRIMLSLDNTWQSLPSLSPQEVIVHLQVQGISSEYVDIKYSRFNNLYYIKIKDGVSTIPCEVMVDFLLLVPLREPNPFIQNVTNKKFTNKELQAYLEEFSAFEEGELEGLPDNPTKQQIMEEVYKQKRGVCRHRARAFKFGWEKYRSGSSSSVKVRVIRNVSHEYVEVQENPDGPWIQLHFLGKPGEFDCTSQTDDLFDTNGYYLLVMSFIKKMSRIVEGVSCLLPTLQFSRRKWSRSSLPLLVDGVSDSSELDSAAGVSASTWDPVVQWPRDSVAFVDDLRQRIGRKILVQHEDSAIISALLILLQQQAIKSRQNIFVAHSPDDLICSRPWMQLVAGDGKDDHMTASICAAPGGPLHRFLTDSSRSPAILVVDYRTFTAQQIVSFNTLLDKKRVVDGVELPGNIIIIALQAGKSSYQGSDFISRFDEVVDCPSLSISPDLVTIGSVVKPGTDDVTDVITVDLHQSPFWKSLLLGEWIIDGDKMTFKPGALFNAVNSAKSLHIINRPVGDADFDNLVQNILLQRYLDVYGVKLVINEFFKITYSSGYNWEELKAAATFKPAVVSEAKHKLALNPTTFGSFLNRYEIRDGKYYSQPGILSAGTGSSAVINIIVTRSLSLAEWSLFLAKCSKLGVKPIIEIGRNVVMPPELGLDVTTEGGVSVIDFVDATDFADQHTLVIFSKDSDRTAKQIIEKQASEKVLEIDISECTPNDIFVHIDGKFEEQKLLFSQYDCAVLDYLKRGRTVILRGRFSDELIDAIAEYQFKYVADATGKLILIVDPAESKKFGFMPNQYTHTITLAESLVREFAKQQYKTAFGEEGGESAPWLGVTALPADACAVSTASAADFEYERKQAIQKALASYPFVFIAGPTGTGKSTFVDKVLRADSLAYEIHIGESKILEWALSKSEGERLQVLFIDEANIGNRDWTEFEGLFAAQPFIMVAGKLYELSPNHKVIFAGNPLSYGGDRHLPLLFARRGYSIIFKPMSLDYIKQRILLPALSGIDGDSLEKICELYLKVYKYICDRSPDKILISPRELEMMCLMFMAKKDPSASASDLTVLAGYCAQRITQSLLPDDAHEGLDSLFGGARELRVIDSADVVISDYAITASRKPLLRDLDDLLAVRQFKISASTDVQRYGGLGGLVIEGAPGEGKSHCVVAYLSHLKLEKDKDFYIIPASMESSEKEKLLIKACKEGAVVVIDEINCTDRNERLINDLLMGKLPEGGRPDKSGFLLIATQNPISMPGRATAGSALERRMLKCKLAEYSSAEMLSILTTRVGLTAPLAGSLIELYLSALKQATDSFKTPPNFRDLIKKAEELQRQFGLSEMGGSSVHSLSTVSYVSSVDVCPVDVCRGLEKTHVIGPSYPKSLIMA